MTDFTALYKPYRVIFGEDLGGLSQTSQEYLQTLVNYSCHQWFWWHNQGDNDPFWEFENPDTSSRYPHWVLYSEADNATLEAGYQAYLANNRNHETPINANFSAGYWREYNGKLIMIQFRTNSPLSCRPIFRSSYCWLWNQQSNPRDPAVWVPYNPDVSRKLETAYLERALDTEINVNGVPYIVNFAEMAQHHKNSTLIRRAVRRIGTELTQPFLESYGGEIIAQAGSRDMGLSAFWLPNVPMNTQVASQDERRLVLEEFTGKFVGSLQHYGTVPGSAGSIPTTTPNVLAVCKFQAARLLGAFEAKVAEIGARAQEVVPLNVELNVPLLDIRTNEYYMWYAPPTTQLTVQLISGNLQKAPSYTLHESPVLANAELDCPNCNAGSRHNAKNSTACNCAAQGGNPCVLFYCRVVLGDCCKYIIKNVILYYVIFIYYMMLYYVYLFMMMIICYCFFA